MKKLFTGKNAAILPVLFLIVLIGGGPFITAMKDSFIHEISGTRSFAGMDNFKYILSDKAFSYSLNITILWATLNVILSLILGFLLALCLIQNNKRSALIYRTLLIPWGIPIYIAVPLWRAFLHGNGGESLITKLTGFHINLMIDPVAGFLGSLGVSLWLSVPLAAFVFAGHMRKISKQVVEAAQIDGAGKGELALYIYIPQIRESILAMGVLNFIKAFKEFTLVFMMTAGGPPLISGITDRHIVGATTTLGVFLFEVFLQVNDWGISAAYSLIMTGLVLFILAIWVFTKNNAPLFFFLTMTFIAQIPGGNTLLYIIGAAYLAAIAFPLILPWITAGHVVYTVLSVYKLGFLQGFHPGILIGLLSLLIYKTQTARQRTLNRIPLYKWKGIHFRIFISPKVTDLSAKTFSWLYIIITGIILYMLFWMSLSNISSCYIDNFMPKLITGNNFIHIFKDDQILRYFLNTLFISTITALLLPFIIFPGAVWLNNIGKKRSLFFLGLIQALGVTGGMHSLIPLYKIFLTLGMINTYIPLVLIYLYHALPFSLFILTAYMENFPSSFKDLARIEGMPPFIYTFRILLPLSLPPLFTTIMIAFTGSWNGFQAPLLFLNDEKIYTISLKLYSYIGNLGSGTPSWNYFAAASVVNTIIIGSLFIKFKKPGSTTAISEGNY